MSDRVSKTDCFCDYCGLPVPGVVTRTDRVSIYCCLGCKLAAAVMRERGDETAGRSTLTRLGLGVFFAMNVMVFTLALWSWDVYEIDASGRAELLRELLRYACLLFAVPVLLLLGGPLFESTIANLRRKQITTDVLLSLGVLTAYAYSIISVMQGGRHVYFEVGSTILVAVTLGRWLEAQGKQQATRALSSLQRLIPETVRLVRDGLEQAVNTDSIVAGDQVRVMPAERVPLDGRLLSSSGQVDQQIITGESELIQRQFGDFIYGGSLNGNQELLLEVSAAANDGTVQRMIDIVQQAAVAKNRYQRLADRAAAWFVPSVMLLSLSIFGWYLAHNAFHDGLMTALSILLISCPCAMAIATPLAAWCALGEAARRGVLFRNSDGLLRLAEVQSILFDKTGTLTTGKMVGTLPHLIDPKTDRHTLDRIAFSLASASRHPLCQAILHRGPIEGSPLKIRNLQIVPGQGVCGILPDGERVALGKASFVASDADAIQGKDQVGSSTFGLATANSELECYVGWSGQLRGSYHVQEQLRPHVVPLLRWLKDRAYSVAVLTGDRIERAQTMQQVLAARVVGGLMPEDKLQIVREQQAGRNVVAFIGDGVNDAAALAAADVGIALGCGADVTREAGIVCLLADELHALPCLLELAKATQKTIRHNLIWAFGYNLVGVGFAMTGRLNPILAALAMIVSSLYVITNSLRLRPLATRLWNDAVQNQLWADQAQQHENMPDLFAHSDPATAGASL